MIRGILGRGGRKTATKYPRGLLGIDQLHSPSDFVRIASDRVSDAKTTMTNWRAPPPPDRTPEQDIEILDGVSNSLCGIADAAEFIRNVHEEPEWVSAATDAVQSVASFMNDANVDSGLFERARGIRETNIKSNEHKRVIHAMVEAMENEGVHLSGDKKEKLVTLLDKDAIKSFEIVNTRKDESPKKSTPGVWFDFENVPQPLLKMLPSRTENGRVKHFVPSDSGFGSHLMKRVDSREVRQQLWESQNAKSDSVLAKEQAMHELVETRRELARIRGYPSWNHYAQRESVMTPIGGPAAVEKFLAQLWVDLEPGLERELSALRSLNKGQSIEPWDMDYLCEKWKAENQSATAPLAQIQSHLSFSRILAGGQTVARNVLGVDMQFDKSASDLLWHKDAFRLALSRIDTDEPLGYLYIDPYERASKLVQSAQYTLAGSKRIPTGRQTPQTAIVLSLPRDPSIPLPLSFAVTIFHELGHAFHSLLSETDLQHFSGSRGAIDFVEFPSHLFEYFATEPETLRAILPRELVSDETLHAYGTNRSPFGHIEAAQQLVYAMLDQVYYATGDPKKLADHLPGVDKSNLLRLLQPTSTASFEHLVHYGGSYYCYLLSRALAADVWSKAFRNDPWNRDTGERLVRFLKNGSVDQSLDAIYSIVPNGDQKTLVVPTESLIRDFSRCSAIHS